jgi:polar amino acid transport system substrate-binding protein
MRRRLTLQLGLLPGWLAAAPAEPPLLRSSSQAGFAHKYNPGGAGPPGFCIDYIQALKGVDAGLGFSGLEQMLPTLRIEQDLAAGRIDVFFAMLRTPEREALFRFVDGPRLYSIHHRIAVLASDAQAGQVRGFADLRALRGEGRVLITKGNGLAALLREQGVVDIDDGATSPEQNLRKLLGGRARFLYDSESLLQRTIQAQGLHDRVRVLPVVFRRQELLLACSPGLAPEHLARVTAAMRVLEGNGVAARLRAAYDLS